MRTNKLRLIEALNDVFQRVVPFVSFASFLLFTPVAYAQNAQEGINQTGPNAQGTVINNIINNNYNYNGPVNADKNTLPKQQEIVEVPEPVFKPRQDIVETPEPVFKPQQDIVEVPERVFVPSKRHKQEIVSVPK